MKDGYDPKKKTFKQEIELIHDLEPLEVTEEEAKRFKHEHGDECDAWAAERDQWYIKLKKGARVYVPKAIIFSRALLVARFLMNGMQVAPVFLKTLLTRILHCKIRTTRTLSVRTRTRAIFVRIWLVRNTRPTMFRT